MARLDSLRNRLIVFTDSAGRWGIRSAWTLALDETLSWRRLTAKPPEDLREVLVDVPRDRIVAFTGGKKGWRSVPLPDAATWTRLETAGSPPHSEGITAALDPRRRRILVFGGRSHYRDVQGVWALSLEGAPKWTKLETTGPTPRWIGGSSAIYDPRRDRLIVYGGATYSKTSAEPDVWALSFSSPMRWTRLATAGESPEPRWSHLAAYDAERDRMVIFGGSSMKGYLYDAWEFPLGEPDATPDH